MTSLPAPDGGRRQSPSRVIRQSARVGFVAAALAIAYLAFAPFAESPGFGWDKANHGVAFFTLAGLAELGWPGRAGLPWRLLSVLGYGVLIELMQALLPHRHGSVLDFAADVVGVMLWLSLRQAVRACSMAPTVGSPAGPTAASPGAADGRRNAPADSRGSPGG